MRPSKSFYSLLSGLVVAATVPPACGGKLTVEDEANLARAGAARDASPDVTSSSSSSGNCHYEPKTVTVAMVEELCAPAPYAAVPVVDAGADAEVDGSADAAVDADAGVDPATCTLDCDAVCRGYGGSHRCARESETTASCTYTRQCGRAPEGFDASSTARDLGELFASFARLEAAAVLAFERMALELEAHALPAALVRDVQHAARDERRHTRIMSKLARERGHELDVNVDAPMHVRSLFEVALENAVEGCARESVGALFALHQAAHAEDASVRRAFVSIARDEVAHAELSWRVARAVEPLLTERERAAVDRARNDAFAELEHAEADPLWNECGLPDPRLARSLATRFRHVSAMLAAA